MDGLKIYFMSGFVPVAIVGIVMTGIRFLVVFLKKS